MIEYKVILGFLAVLLAFYSYVPYFKDIAAGRTKPHAYSWFVWFILTAIAFVGQIVDGGGAGAWVTGFTAAVSFIIFIAAIYRGEKEITLSDKMSLLGAFIAILLWFLTGDPLLSVILITIIDALGFYPTFRKSYHKPYEETLATYFISGLKFVVSILALQNYTLVTYLYPLSLVIMNWVFVLMLIARRKTIPKRY